MPTNFLWYAGPSGNSGLLTPALTLLTTELNGMLGSGAFGGSGVISSVAGASGLITSSSTGQGMQGDLWFQAGGTFGTATTPGGTIMGWFLIESPTGGQFESPSATIPPPRPPDFIIPITGTPGGLTWWKSTGVHAVTIPGLEFKTFIFNASGAGFPLASNKIIATIPAAQY